MPPDVRDWLPADHFAWFVLDAVAAMELEAFYGAYRADGRSRPAFDPAMMVALILYAHARGGSDHHLGRTVGRRRHCLENIDAADGARMTPLPLATVTAGTKAPQRASVVTSGRTVAMDEEARSHRVAALAIAMREDEQSAGEARWHGKRKRRSGREAARAAGLLGVPAVGGVAAGRWI